MKTWRCTECSREWTSNTDDKECLNCGFDGYVIHDNEDKNLTLQLIEMLESKQEKANVEDCNA